MVRCQRQCPESAQCLSQSLRVVEQTVGDWFAALPADPVVADLLGCPSNTQ